MTDEELWLIVERARAGGGEGEDLEFKRAWWPFDVARAVTEFRRDVVAMANAHANPDRPRHLVIGLDGDGTVYDAPLPVDEAQLQDMIRSKVTPCPRLRVEHHTVEGKRVSVLVLDPLFDRPYVTPDERDRPTVWIRRGSSIGTASRADLDGMYRHQVRAAQVSLRWSDDRGGDVVLPAPVGPDRATLVAGLVADQAVVRAELASSTFPDDDPGVRAAKLFLLESAEFLAEVQDDASFRYWYRMRNRDRRVTVSFVATNSGTAPATELRFALRLPPWMLAVEHNDDDETDSYARDLCSLVVPRRPDLAAVRALAAEMEAERERVRRLLGGMPSHTPPMIELGGAALDPLRDWSPLAISNMGRTILPPSVRVDGNEIQWSFKEVFQDHEVPSADKVDLLALPGAPLGDHVVEGTVFHRELCRRRPIQLAVRVGKLI